MRLPHSSRQEREGRQWRMINRLLDRFQRQERKILFFKEKFHQCQQKAERNLQIQERQVQALNQRLDRFQFIKEIVVKIGKYKVLKDIIMALMQMNVFFFLVCLDVVDNDGLFHLLIAFMVIWAKFLNAIFKLYLA